MEVLSVLSVRQEFGNLWTLRDLQPSDSSIYLYLTLEVFLTYDRKLFPPRGLSRFLVGRVSTCRKPRLATNLPTLLRALKCTVLSVHHVCFRLISPPEFCNWEYQVVIVVSGNLGVCTQPSTVEERSCLGQSSLSWKTSPSLW